MFNFESERWSAVTRSDDGALDAGDVPRRAGGADVSGDGAVSLSYEAALDGVSTATHRLRARDRPPYATLVD